jgi:transcriptional regulator with XRE-family HTH domain
MSPVGTRLVMAYESRGITSRKDISESLGFQSENAIYKVLSGDRELSFDSLRRFAETTGRSIHWLLTGESGANEGDDFRLEPSNMAARLRTTFPGMSAAQMAERLGISADEAAHYLNGVLPATEVLVKIAEETGVSLTWLLTNQGPQWARPAASPRGEIEGLAEEDGSAPRKEPVRQSPDTKGTEDRLLSAQIQLVIEQNNRIIQLLEQLVQKS